MFLYLFSFVPLPHETALAVIYFDQISNDDANVFSLFDDFRLCLSEAGHDKIGRSRNENDYTQKSHDLPEKAVHKKVNEKSESHKENQLNDFNFPVQLTNPCQGGFQSHAQCGNENQG